VKAKGNNAALCNICEDITATRMACRNTRYCQHYQNTFLFTKL